MKRKEPYKEKRALYREKSPIKIKEPYKDKRAL